MHPSSKQVQNFWQHMSATYSSVTKQKQACVEMKAIAVVIHQATGIPVNTFMNNYATTLWSTIYVPFTVGSATDRWSCIDQVIICVHEHQHIVQSRRDGSFTFARRYIFSSTARALYEAEAYRATMQMNQYFYKSPGDPIAYANKLYSYGCSNADVLMATKYLQASLPTIAAQGLIDPSVKVAVPWLKACGIQ